MYISRLKIKNFRCYESELIEFEPGINFITGPNGSGKTNILEAVSVLANVKSFRNVPDFDMAKWNTEGYYISADIYDESTRKFEIGFSNENGKIRKKFKIDESEIKKVSDYYGKLLAVIIAPSDINLLNGGPDIRRSFFDSVISKLDIEYFNTLNDLKKVAGNRNSLLKALREGKIKDTSQLNPWDAVFAEKAAFIINRRIDFISEFAPIFKKSYGQIANKDECPSLEYINNSKAVTERDIIKRLSDLRIKDIMTGNSNIGPQRDEFLFCNSSNIRFINYGSQGQIRTAAIALKISESEIIQNKLSKKAIVLVDDIFSELDTERRNNMVELISSENQVIFTMVDLDVINIKYPSMKKYEIAKDGLISI